MLSLSSPGIYKASGLFVLLGGTGSGRGWKNRVSHLVVGEVVGLDGQMSTCNSVEKAHQAENCLKIFINLLLVKTQ